MRTSRILALVLALGAAAVAGAAEPTRRLALVGGMLLAGYDVPPVHDAAILIEGHRIGAAGPASQVAIPPDAEIIDTSGRTMLPGLIDAHVHLQILGHGDYAAWDPWIAKNGLVERVG